MYVDDLCSFENSDDALYSQYIDLMKFTNTDKLSMLSIRCSKRSVAMLDNYQEIWLWGDGINIGAGKPLKFMDVPFSIGKFLGKSYLNVALRLNHSIAIDSKRKLYLWGSGAYRCHGQLSNEMVWQPKKLSKAIFDPNSGKIYTQHIAASDNLRLSRSKTNSIAWVAKIMAA
jgi:alpha-tubulin suppressor-like RCC1 family protein